MAKTYRVGIVGFAHMHINNVAALFRDHPRAQLVACADTRPLRPELRKGPYTRQWNLEFAQNDLKVPKTYDDYQQMLAQEKLDIAICCAENARHPEVVEACAAVGTHVCVEKPMAMSLAHALRMVRACQAAGTTLLVNWPMTWNPAARQVKALIEQGAVGRVLQVRTRLGHTGPLGPGAAHEGVSESAAPMSGIERGATWWHQQAAGGGAMVDYCCYGAMAARWYIGQPALAATGMRGNLASPWGDADDNGFMIARFPSAVAVMEGSWTTWDHGGPAGPVVYGECGTLVPDARDGSPVVREEHGHGRRNVHVCPALPKGRHDIAHEFIHHLDTREPVHPTLEMLFNLEAMAILDAGVRSADSGKLETVDSGVWRLG